MELHVYVLNTKLKSEWPILVDVWLLFPGMEIIGIKIVITSISCNATRLLRFASSVLYYSQKKE
jgi:hypothetical protein